MSLVLPLKESLQPVLHRRWKLGSWSRPDADLLLHDGPVALKPQADSIH